VKRLVVNPGASLSLQMHHHRAEPSEWALMLSGLGLMGFVARRRRAVSEAA